MPRQRVISVPSKVTLIKDTKRAVARSLVESHAARLEQLAESGLSYERKRVGTEDDPLIPYEVVRAQRIVDAYRESERQKEKDAESETAAVRFRINQARLKTIANVSTVESDKDAYTLAKAFCDNNVADFRMLTLPATKKRKRGRPRRK